MPRNKPRAESAPGSSSPSSALALCCSPAGPGGKQGEVVLLWSDRYEESDILAQLTIISANDLDYSPGWHRICFPARPRGRDRPLPPHTGKLGQLPVPRVRVMGCAAAEQMLHFAIQRVSHSIYCTGTVGVGAVPALLGRLPWALFRARWFTSLNPSVSTCWFGIRISTVLKV